MLAQVVRWEGKRERKMMEMRKVAMKCRIERVTTVIAVRREGGSWEVVVVVEEEVETGVRGSKGDVVPGRGVNARKRSVLARISEIFRSG